MDHSYHKGRLKWIPVSQTHYWQVNVNRVITIIQNVINAKPFDQQYLVPCSTINSLPSIIFTINGNKYPVPAQAYIWKEPMDCSCEEVLLCKPSHTTAYTAEPMRLGHCTHNLFNPQLSTTLRFSGQSFNLGYGAGRIVGITAYNIVWIMNLINLGQAFVLSQKQNGLVDAIFDGVLGLGHPSLTAKRIIPVSDNLKTRGVISKPVFAFYLSTKKENGSMVMFGEVDHSYHQGEPKWILVSRTNYWQITTNRITMVGVILGCSRSCQAIMDTGTALLLGPTRVITMIQNLTKDRPFDQQYLVPCSDINSLLSIIFTVNGNEYPVPTQATSRRLGANPGG
ncbi:pregnancy-associated glycoprotein 2-like [Hippopotamus amphibius kiboko]|uniref:pregnancy-associated glycoprotein 2-like n=1 Tax=Hippopotamus amphibius kiboko TaxID=575201 RepID=UPI0025959B6B|nr:pregnancy-associated glycoprotein 2-like [Hippopotamus amphibius kiboko]